MKEPRRLSPQFTKRGPGRIHQQGRPVAAPLPSPYSPEQIRAAVRRLSAIAPEGDFARWLRDKYSSLKAKAEASE